MKTVVTVISCLLITSAAMAGVVVTADDGAEARLTAMRRTADALAARVRAISGN